MTALPNRRYSGHCQDREEEDEQGILGKETWSDKYGHKYGWRKMKEIGLDRNNGSVVYVTLGVMRHKVTPSDGLLR